tara:strand:+ start:1243 stop:1866 length:624 start_codon:yes stop_codon:yes gene_type:complete
MIYKKLNYKIFFFAKVILLYLILSTVSHSADLKKGNNLVTLGSNEAKVKIKIFSSFTCPHCASFHIQIIPKLKKEYVDTGKVQLIFIDFPLDQVAFNASKLLHCLDKNNQITFMDTIYKTQAKWTSGTNVEEINANLKKIVMNLGISSTKFEDCLVDEVISDKILNGRIDATKKYSINSTPTIVINEKKLEESANFKNIKKRIEKLI